MFHYLVWSHQTVVSCFGRFPFWPLWGWSRPLRLAVLLSKEVAELFAFDCQATRLSWSKPKAREQTSSLVLVPKTFSRLLLHRGTSWIAGTATKESQEGARPACLREPTPARLGFGILPIPWGNNETTLSFLLPFGPSFNGFEPLRNHQVVVEGMDWNFHWISISKHNSLDPLGILYQNKIIERISA